MSQIKSTMQSFAADTASTIYRARRNRKLSVEELSRRSGVSTQLIRQCERKAILPHDEALTALAGALHCKVSVLLGKTPLLNQEEEDQPYPPLPPAEAPSPEFMELTRRVTALYGQGS